ncbi:MAG: hypothetical protein NXH95_15235 [Pseudomonadaceae bacterium]|nr:hypothetical protein [Pseudomonadaceae bacterium]
MQQVIKFLFSPLAFAVGFLWPLFSQILLASQTVESNGLAISIGAVVAIGWGLMAQVRGSWIWIK